MSDRFYEYLSAMLILIAAHTFGFWTGLHSGRPELARMIAEDRRILIDTATLQHHMEDQLALPHKRP